MLAFILALAVGLGSFSIYMAAFFFPEVHRKSDFVWSGVGRANYRCSPAGSNGGRRSVGLVGLGNSEFAPTSDTNCSANADS